jgi:HK97 gp10 family phage protein
MPGGGFFLALRAVGAREAAASVSRVDLELKQGLRGRLKEAAQLVAGEARQRTHSRRVRGAITYDVEVRSLSEYRALIGPLRKKAFFAHFLEFGTEHSREFPFLAPALGATEDKVIDLVGIPPSLGGGR